ncbi:tetratricopeptide repeat protein [Brevibacillus humidisoli]|uniref:tetratricopeptide repeat protein n=1 Tax=Brevibacillus humidisoli TaxID=2895522 RepID=UPI001E56E87C|nr:tetratricopeptide repeat protein [Brevibacillus humidisoli]UFJ39976.1 tetratricopeptide repeat protein [Brevibacillus humidisoli]
MKNSEGMKKRTVVAFERDASFFVQRGVRLAQRSEYEKAIKYFRRAVELEPTNANCLCHLASVLAEIGQFSESNDILHQIVEQTEPGMVEVYFYLANNYANMEDYQMAEEMALRYLQESVDGTFALEAEELLDYIYFELDIPPRGLEEESDNLHFKHEQARKSLEDGRFLEATELLQEVIQADDDFTPAWNNLALAYYYVGDFNRAMQTIEETLARDPGNLHALCNLAVLLSHHNRTGELAPLLEQLRKTVPLHHEQLYKLATTLGVLGQHKEAFRLYRRLFRFWGQHDACTYHYAAISAYQCGHQEQAIRWWQRAKQLDPDTGIADYYLHMVKEREEGNSIHEIPYQYQIPFKGSAFEHVEWTRSDELKSDPMIRASLLWAMQHGTAEVKKMVIQTLALIGDDEAEEALRRFCRTADDEYLLKLALVALSQMGAALPYEVGAFTVGEEADHVADCIRTCLSREEHAELRRWALLVWSAYCQYREDPPKTRKPEAWVAALEYLYGKLTSGKVTQKSLAAKYGLSQPTIAKCAKEISALDLHKF